MTAAFWKWPSLLLNFCEYLRPKGVVNLESSVWGDINKFCIYLTRDLGQRIKSMNLYILHNWPPRVGGWLEGPGKPSVSQSVMNGREEGNFHHPAYMLLKYFVIF